MPDPRMTAQTLAVLEALLARPEVDEEAWGFEISRTTGLAAGTLYPILARLVAAGWIEDRWEDPATGRPGGRPPRRYYRLTTRGRARATHASDRAARPTGPGRLEAGEMRPRSELS